MGCLCSKSEEAAKPGTIDESGTLHIANFWDLYEFKAEIAKGGSCDVLRVKDHETKKIYAAKELHDYKFNKQKLFLREVSILKKIEPHPNILKFIGSYRDKSNYFIVTEFLGGGELFERIVKAKEFKESVVCKIVQQMLSAISHLHKYDIVHRDLKPENFVFEDTSEMSKIVMIDFGSALESQAGHVYREICGTPYYMPPEAQGTKGRDLKTMKSGDMYSIGVITYIMMSGIPPFGGDTDKEIFEAVKKFKWGFPPENKWSDGLKHFVTLCLKKNPSERISVAEALYHPWVVGDTASKDSVDLQVISSLRKFVHETKLQKAIVNLMVKNVSSDDEDQLKRMFARIDYNKDNNLSQNEIVDSLISLGMYEPQAKLEAQKIMNASDVDKNGYINFEEFVEARARTKLSNNVLVLHGVFKVLDNNNDGFVSSQELKGILSAEQDEEINNMIKEVDKNNDGKISFDEFVSALSEKQTERVVQTLRKSVGASDRRISQRTSMNKGGRGHEKDIIE